MQEQNNIMEKIMKNISILGSTGSIGTQTLDIVRANNDLNVVAIAAGSNVKMFDRGCYI